ncbi:hypothetical protein [Pseudovibrio sp. Tun.PSC04-5.I4]|uniref:hypothetical protein n=1 Tax=Pseudovibrio sp. Tun.PSC04-5.I4 TaxID=1798213 RepID=UPI00088AC903|nr:hypothetical protein [Pseudovibrio sp. Tun.PSC04-5.I4]SDQ17845.1 hypothetical protein SAMN04515695_0342 [Pseudovibrio sp. Tun.PSC04-5.I4]
MTDFVPVTDHAVLRYLERVLDIDVQMVRRHIYRETENALQVGAKGLRRDGVRYVLEGGAVVTVMVSEAQLASNKEARHV